MTFFLLLVLCRHEPRADLSQSDLLFQPSVRVLSAARQDQLLLVGLETSVVALDLESGVPTSLHLEEHRTTAVSIHGHELFAATVSIYTLDTPIVYRSEQDAAGDWMVLGLLPPGSGEVRRIHWVEDAMWTVSAGHVFRWQNGTPQSEEPGTGALVDVRRDQDQMVAMVNEADGPILWLYSAGTWQQQALFVDMDPVSAFAISDNRVLMADEQGQLWHFDGEALTFVAASEPSIASIDWHGREALVAHPNSLSWLTETGRIRTLIQPAEFLATPLLVADTERFMYICSPTQPFRPVPCIGLYRWQLRGRILQP